MILFIDNYDSFSHNLLQGLQLAGARVDLRHHDDATLESLDLTQYQSVMFGPGPGRPEHAGALMATLAVCIGRLPVLGICLGMQAIAQHFGGRVVAAPEPLHGVVSSVQHDATGIFRDLPSPIEATRYHSLCVDAATLPDCLVINARSDDGVPMALRHRQLPVAGLQFHPESIATPMGQNLLEAFLGGEL